MKSILDKLGLAAKRETKYSDDFANDDYVEIPSSGAVQKEKARVVVRPFIIEEFQDIKPALDAIRGGFTIALLNIRPLRDKDLIELKRAVNKLKKTCDAIEGDIAGFGEDWIVITPSFASIYRTTGDMGTQPVEKQL